MCNKLKELYLTEIKRVRKVHHQVIYQTIRISYYISNKQKRSSMQHTGKHRIHRMTWQCSQVHAPRTCNTSSLHKTTCINVQIPQNILENVVVQLYWNTTVGCAMVYTAVLTNPLFIQYIIIMCKEKIAAYGYFDKAERHKQNYFVDTHKHRVITKNLMIILILF